jgi:predicted nucleic acid-binding Zn ribbon protein
MLKIHCFDCAKDFIWTDDMPVRGKCPNPDCDGLYDVHAALRQNLEARKPTAVEALLCPACGGPIPSRWTVCSGCGRVVVSGTRSFRKRHFLFLIAATLLFLSLIIRAWLRF